MTFSKIKRFIATADRHLWALAFRSACREIGVSEDSGIVKTATLDCQDPNRPLGVFLSTVLQHYAVLDPGHRFIGDSPKMLTHLDGSPVHKYVPQSAR